MAAGPSRRRSTARAESVNAAHGEDQRPVTYIYASSTRSTIMASHNAETRGGRNGVRGCAGLVKLD